MTYISSQHYINDEIVREKMDQLAGATEITVPCYYVGVIDGVEYAMQSDGHHALAAARELGIPVVFAVEDDPEGLTGEQLLDTHWMDGDWYNVETSAPANSKFDLIW